MESHQSFSPGLLYSVAPQNFSQLHLHDDSELDDFNWEEYEAQFGEASFTQVVVSFLIITANKWGITKFH